MYNTSRCPEIENRLPGLIAAIINAHKVQLETRPGNIEKSPKPGEEGLNRVDDFRAKY